MRKLQSTDFFAFTKIIKKMNIREDLKKIAKDVTKIELPKGDMTDEERENEFIKVKKVAINEMQLELLMIFIENIGNAELEVYKFVSNISEKSIEELKDAGLFMESIEKIFNDETIKSFFKLALK